MWWFAALHANLLLLYRRVGGGNAAQPLLDAGCGTGGLLARIAAAYPERAAVGLDAEPFADAAFGAIFSADVLCHRDVDEHAALRQFHRCLAEGGVLVLNLPAYGWLMSRHDQAVYNVRRYTRRGLVRLLEASGFRVIHASY